MKIRLGLISWATGALVLAAVSACGGDNPRVGSAALADHVDVVTESAPQPTTSPTSPSEVAAARRDCG